MALKSTPEFFIGSGPADKTFFGFDFEMSMFQVFFNYIDVPKLSSFRSSTPVEDDTASLLSDSFRSRNEESKLGFNMCECGFEGINIKVAKRSSNQVDDDTLEDQEP